MLGFQQYGGACCGKILLLAHHIRFCCWEGKQAGMKKKGAMEDIDESYTATEFVCVLTGFVSPESCHYITPNGRVTYLHQQPNVLREDNHINSMML